jgi:hypothetical protein
VSRAIPGKLRRFPQPTCSASRVTPLTTSANEAAKIPLRLGCIVADIEGCIDGAISGVRTRSLAVPSSIGWSDDRAKSPFCLKSRGSPHTARCCDIKMNTAALAIEHLAHGDAVCRCSRLKDSADHRPKQPAVNLQHDRRKHFPTAIGVATEGRARHVNTLPQARPGAQYHEASDS